MIENQIPWAVTSTESPELIFFNDEKLQEENIEEKDAVDKLCEREESSGLCKNTTVNRKKGGIVHDVNAKVTNNTIEIEKTYWSEVKDERWLNFEMTKIEKTSSVEQNEKRNC